MRDNVHDFLLKYRDAPWTRGRHDCVLFIWKYTKEVFGKPYADPEKYPFHDLSSAKRAYIKICRDNGARTFEDVLDKHYDREPFPVHGGIVAKPDNEGLTGYTYGVCYEGFGFFVGEKGLTPMELNPKTDLFWSVA